MNAALALSDRIQNGFALLIAVLPLVIFTIATIFHGRQYFRARWPFVAVFYVLVAGHEFMGRFVPVSGPMCLLALCIPFLCVFLMIPPAPLDVREREQRGFPVIERNEQNGD